VKRYGSGGNRCGHLVREAANIVKGISRHSSNVKPVGKDSCCCTLSGVYLPSSTCALEQIGRIAMIPGDLSKVE
jgi:hypothetical protein